MQAAPSGVFMLTRNSEWIIKTSDFARLLESFKWHQKKGTFLHCRLFIWMLNIYTPLNVYMWMYLRFISIKSHVGRGGQTRQKVLAVCVNPLLTPENTHTHTHIYPPTHTNIQFIKCPTHNIPETILKLLSVNKQSPNLQQWQNGCRRGNHFSSLWMLL